MVVMNETQLYGKMKVSLEPSYLTWSKNRTLKGGGGVASSVARSFMSSAIGAGEGAKGDEYLITRFACFNPALNVINCYGEQRGTPKTEVEEKWIRLRQEMENVRARNEFCVLAGDLNKLVGCGEFGVSGNHPELSYWVAGY